MLVVEQASLIPIVRTIRTKHEEIYIFWYKTNIYTLPFPPLIMPDVISM